MKDIMKIAIIGSKRFRNYSIFTSSIKKIFPVEAISKLLSGNSIGLDSLVEKFAHQYNIPHKKHSLEWDAFGGKYTDNERLIEECDIVIAFYNGNCEITRDSLNQAKEKNKKVYIVKI